MNDPPAPHRLRDRRGFTPLVARHQIGSRTQPLECRPGWKSPRERTLERGLPDTSEGALRRGTTLLGWPGGERVVGGEGGDAVDVPDGHPWCDESGGVCDRGEDQSCVFEVEAGDVFAEVDRSTLSER